MAGIYIPGMEMPTSCDNCAHPTCTLWQSVNGGERHEKCPLVLVHDHGRLIDADALYEKFLLLESEAMSALQTTGIGSVDGIKWSAILTERTGYKFDIVDAPTIIPAEEGQ